MRCLNCGGEFKETKGSLALDNENIGKFTVHGVEYKKCNKCNKLRFPAKAAKKIEETKKQIENKLIGNLPISEFIGATAAAEILNISRQAIHKHRRVRRGFIHSIKFEGKILYHIESVKLFKESGDGRFQLYKPMTKRVVKYISVKRNLPKGLSWDTPYDQSFKRSSTIGPSFIMNQSNKTIRGLRK